MFLSDYPRSRLNYFWFWRFPALDAFSVAPALPIPLLLACSRFPVPLLSLPPRPSPCCLPAALAAISLASLSRMKKLLASLEKTTASTRLSCPALSSPSRLLFARSCRTLGRAHGRSRLPEAQALGREQLLSGAQ